MTNLDITNSSSDSSSASTSDSSSSGSSSSSSDSGSSSSDSDSSVDTPAVAPVVPPEPVKSPKPVTEEPKKKEEKTKKAPVVTKVSSSSEDEAPKLDVAKLVPTRRRSSAKAKTTATINNSKPSKPAPKTTTERKPPPRAIKAAKTESQGALKKKSIFSPDNSTESESEDSRKTSVKTPPTRGKGRPRKNSKDNEKLTPKKEPPPKEVPKRRSGSTTSGPPPKKSSASSCTSSQSSTESDSTSSSERETRKKAAEIKTEVKSGKTKPAANPSNRTKPKSEPVKPAQAEKAATAEKPEATMPRKLTRSLSARVSRLATISRPTHTDTDSDNDERIAKAKANESKKGRRSAIKSPASRLAPLQLPEPGERRCPVRGCDSLGHLGGHAEKHFTYDACPLYHNVTPAWCVAACEERAAAAVARNKAVMAMQQRPRTQPTIEQRAYQLKVKDMRSKWKGSQEFRDKQAASGLDECMNLEREPILEGFVPDYDMQLFREAQALAAINIEEELGDIVTDKGTRYVVMGKYMMEVWYQSPYPGEAARAPRLFVCEFCLNHQRCAVGAKRHRSKCRWRHPPGDEVYRDGALSVWQVDGRKHRQYCQQLCLLAKYFLDHKTLYYDVEPFLFYVMTVADAEGCHVVGYFSKEKNSFLNYNVSCILTLPPYQRQGYGRLLIDFSYLLTKVEGKVGSPETPLSDLGLISYRSYWKEALLKRLCSAPGPALCIRDLSKDLAIASCDIVSTLQERGLMKYWKGKHIVLKKQDVLEDVSRRAARLRCVSASCLRWAPPAPPPPR